MFRRLCKAVKLAKTLAEIPERLAAIEERVKKCESYHTISIPSITHYLKYPETSPNLRGCIDGKGCEYESPWFGITPPVTAFGAKPKPEEPPCVAVCEPLKETEKMSGTGSSGAGGQGPQKPATDSSGRQTPLPPPPQTPPVRIIKEGDTSRAGRRASPCKKCGESLHTVTHYSTNSDNVIKVKS